MTRNKWILVGCGCAAACVLVMGVLFVLFVAYAAQDPKGISVSIEVPDSVLVDEEFTLAVVIQNARPDRHFDLASIDIGDEYLAHFLLVETKPPFDSSMHVPIDDSRSFVFEERIPALSTARFEFTLRATDAGLFRGDLDVCEDLRFLTTYVQTRVKRQD